MSLAPYAESKGVLSSTTPMIPKPNVWPAESAARSVLRRFANIPDVEQSRRMMTRETFTTQMFTKVQEQVVKEQKQNERKKMTNVMFPCLNVDKIQNLSLADLNEMGNLVGQNLRDIERSIKFLNHEKKWGKEMFQLAL